MNNYLFFWSGPFSNFHPINGDESLTSERLYMEFKAYTFQDYETYHKINNSKTPKEAKGFGRTIAGYDDAIWNNCKYFAMKIAISSKLKLDEKFREILFGSKGKTLVEASPYDRIWGIGYRAENALENYDNWGENLLGKVLMDLRDNCVL